MVVAACASSSRRAMKIGSQINSCPHILVFMVLFRWCIVTPSIYWPAFWFKHNSIFSFGVGCDVFVTSMAVNGFLLVWMLQISLPHTSATATLWMHKITEMPDKMHKGKSQPTDRLPYWINSFQQFCVHFMQSVSKCIPFATDTAAATVVVRCLLLLSLLSLSLLHKWLIFFAQFNSWYSFVSCNIGKLWIRTGCLLVADTLSFTSVISISRLKGSFAFICRYTHAIHFFFFVRPSFRYKILFSNRIIWKISFWILTHTQHAG